VKLSKPQSYARHPREVNASTCQNKCVGGDRKEYLDQQLYDQKYAIELIVESMDGYRLLLNKFDTTVAS
jgi:hypothetical protein